MCQDLGDDGMPIVRLPPQCCRCGSLECEERFSLGIYAGRWCAPCWADSGYRKEPASAFDAMDAGESYEPDE